jgi:3D (Asp-Asp-Asp) domain-containing protein
MANDYPQWKQKSHYGGFSDDRFMGIQNSFAYAKAVEIRKNPNSLTLAYAVDKDSGTVVTDLINAFVTISTTGDIIGFSNTGKIYRKTAGAGNWANCYTQTSNPSILNAYEYNAYLYWFTAGKMHRIALADIDDTWSGSASLSIDYKSFTNGNANAHPAIELNNKLYVGDGFYLAELDSFGTFTGNKLEIFHDEEIRAITFGGAMMRIYSRKSTKIEGGHKYYWDGSSAAYAERVYFAQVIHCAIANGGDDYVIAGRRPFLYNASGYAWNKLKRLPLVFDTENCYLSPNAMTYFDDLVAFAPAESGNASIGRGIWTWGQEDFKYPLSLNFDYPTSNNNTTDIIGAVHNSNGTLYFSWKKTTTVGEVTTYTYGIDKVNVNKYAATGELHSRVHYGDEADETKGLMGVKMAFDTLRAGEKIDVYFRKNLAAAFSATPELTAAYSDASDQNVVDKRDDIAMEIGDYNFLETKIILTAGTSQLTTPELIELSVLFDPDVEVGEEID